MILFNVTRNDHHHNNNMQDDGARRYGIIFTIIIMYNKLGLVGLVPIIVRVPKPMDGFG